MTTPPRPRLVGANQRLDSWKEIAAYLGRSDRTVRRWEETEGLPVHRLVHEQRGSVYAYSAELDEWREKRKLSTAPEPLELPARVSRLRWILAAAGVASLAALVTLLSLRPAPAKMQALAILPFANVSGDKSLDYLGPGMAEGLAGYLTGVPGLAVRPLSSSAKFRGVEVDAAAAGRKLEAEMVLTGSTALAGQDLKFNVALIDVSSNSQIWSSSYAIHESELAALEPRIGSAVREQVMRRITGRTDGTVTEIHTAQNTANPAAYRAFLEGSYWCHSMGRSQVKTGIARLEEAVRLDPGYARAYATLAVIYTATMWFDEVPAREAMAKGQKAALRALELNPTHAGAWKALGLTHAYLNLDYPAALKDHLKAMECDPRNSNALQVYAETLMEMRRYQEALPYIQRAVDLSPASPTFRMSHGALLLFAGRTDEAVQTLQRAVELEPNHGMIRLYLGRAYLMKGQYTQAIDELRKADALVGQGPVSRAELGRGLAIAGYRAEAEQILAEMTQRRKAGYYPAFAFAEVHLGLGNRELAMDWLERAFDERNTGFYLANGDPMWDAMRPYPRFKKILEQVKL